MNTTNSQDSAASTSRIPPPVPEPSFRPPGASASAGGNYRWVIVGLLLFSTTINSLDKYTISYLKSYFCDANGFGWSNSDFANVTSAFTIVWAVSTIFAGIIIDKIGSRLGLGLSVTVWSTFEILNSLAGRIVGLHMLTRSLLGVGEAGNFPASLKIVAEWFPKKERAFATSIFNSVGTSLGAMIAALFVPWCLVTWRVDPVTGIDKHFLGLFHGWQMALVLTGLIGFVWLAFWFFLGGVPAKLRGKRLSEAEYAYIHSDIESGPKVAEAKDSFAEVVIKTVKLLTFRQTWAYALGKFMTDGIWWFYLFWLPDYLEKQFSLTPQQAGRLCFVVWLVAFTGILGGVVPMRLMNRGWHVYKARFTSMLIFAALPLSMIVAQYFANHRAYFGGAALVFALVFISIAVAGHQMWSANLYTTPSDMFPKKAVATVSGIGIAAGGLGGYLIQKLVGWLTDYFEGLNSGHTAYTIMFFIAAFAYLAAWLVIKVLVPRHKPVTDL